MRFENVSQEGREETVIREGSTVAEKVFGEIDQVYCCPTRAIRGSWSLTGYSTFDAARDDNVKTKTIKERKYIVRYMVVDGDNLF